MAPTLVTELVALSRRSEIHTSRAAGFVVCRAIACTRSRLEQPEARCSAHVFPVWGRGRPHDAPGKGICADKWLLCLGGVGRSESVGATAEDDAHTRIIYLALTDEITAILNLVSSGSGDALSTAESQVKRVSRPKSIKSLALDQY